MCHGQILDDAVRRARKRHRCNSCGRTLAVGERHRAESIARDGEAFTLRSCRRCASAMDTIQDYADPGDGCLYAPREAMHEEAKERGWRAMRAALRVARSKLFGPAAASSPEAR